MHVEVLTVGMFQSNCYLLSCERTGEAILIDPGDEGERILSVIESRNLQIKAIVNTHASVQYPKRMVFLDVFAAQSLEPDFNLFICLFPLS